MSVLSDLEAAPAACPKNADHPAPTGGATRAISAGSTGQGGAGYHPPMAARMIPRLSMTHGHPGPGGHPEPDPPSPSASAEASPAPVRVEPGVPVRLPRGLRRGDEVEITIARLGDTGRGVADVEALVGPGAQALSYRVEVRKAVVGDRVRARLEGGRRRRLEARMVALVSPAPGRIAPRCPHFGQREHLGRGCGGCTQQVLPYDRQLELKRALVRAALAPAGITPEAVAPVESAGEPFYYRNKMELSFGDDRRREFALGLYPTGWHNEVIPLTECSLMSPFASELPPRVAAWARALGLRPFKAREGRGFLRQLTLREGKRTGERMVELVTTGDGEVETCDGLRPAEDVARAFERHVTQAARELGAPLTSVYWTQHHAVKGQRTRLDEHLLAGAPVIHEALELEGGRRLTFALHPRAFFQPNTRGAEVLARVIRRLAARKGAVGAGQVRRGGLASATDPWRVLDLYCGTGTWATVLAAGSERPARAVGVDVVPEAVAQARERAAANGLANATFLAADAGEALASGAVAQGLGGPPDVVVVDPPRAGLSPKALRHLLDAGGERVVYVSCNPSSLARDLGPLVEAGYAVEAVQPVDLFPQTHHVETVVALKRQRL